jgi:hypothetical protein
MLDSWRDTETREAIVRFAESAERDLEPAERVAVFDNDGTLWCEKPMPIELDFIVRRLAAMAAGFRLVVLHDDAEREFDYTAGADSVLASARSDGWTVVSVKDDWSQVFAEG